ncbi:MAG: NAD-dependent histone deacetylase sir2 [Alyxoria varia]|nr:MAG: NAD-dependent histone deacetylase sir2 [Alyxoria varia]
MAGAGPAADGRRLRPAVIDLSNDDLSEATTSDPKRSTSAENEDDVDEEQFSDSSSLLNDILNHESDDDDEPQNIDRVSPEEAATLKSRLRQVGPEEFIKETVSSHRYTAKRLCTAFGVIPPGVFDGRPDTGYYRLLGLAIIRELASRQKLTEYNNIDDVAKLLRERKNIMVITGAGISTNLGVPDFRSKDTGFYAQMREKGFDSPEDVFNISIFDEDPSIFYENSGKTLPEPGKTTPTHAFIKLLEDKGRLMTNYTQNIDNVEGNVGISPSRLIHCHGSWATFTCRKCKFQAPGSQFYDHVRMRSVAYCPVCVDNLKRARPSSLKRKRSYNVAGRSRSRRAYDRDSDSDGDYDIPQPGVMKPDITFFGEKLAQSFFDRFKRQDRDKVDLVLVIGTSMTVAPVSEIPQALPSDVPHIYISRDVSLNKAELLLVETNPRQRVRHIQFDVTLLGDCDVIVSELAKRAGWNLKHPWVLNGQGTDLHEIDHDMSVWRVAPQGTQSPSPERVIPLRQQ